ncbi:MAG: DUF4404 family protein [Deltaproteobacteria bacterium]|nr:MAG: DUF4404 family protein [Deltaproteobacteria bacterium]
MPERELRTLVGRLREELARSEKLDEDAREQLRAIAAEIDELLEGGAEASNEEKSSQERSLVERLTEASRAFESSHPRLVEALGRIADTLAKLGI